jgi:glycosyltransferase involved in cell wall biosynthesis
MRVAVDARTVFSAHRRGTGKNLVDLYRHVARLRPDWSFLMIHRDHDATDNPYEGLSNVTHTAVEMRGDRWHWWEQVRLPLAARTWRADVLHSPANTAARFPLVPLLATIHDLIPLDIGAPSAATIRWEREVGYAARGARRILTPSAYTRDRIVAHYGVPPTRIVVNPWAPDTGCRRVDDAGCIDEVRERYGLRSGQPYLLAFGAADPRKNARRILEAWAGLEPAVRDRAALLMVGLQGPILEELRGLMRLRARDGDWSLMGFAAEADIPALLSGAVALVYPSLSEGFGLPILDAFACGAPVITSQSTSLPEVAGDAAILVDPTDTTAIRRAMRDVVVDSSLADTLVERGRKRLANYSWERCARTVADVLAECL